MRLFLWFSNNVSSKSVFVILNRFWNNYGCLYLRRVWIFRGHHWLDLLRVYTDFRCWRGWQACKSQAAGPLLDARETRDAANMSIISKWAAISSSHKSWHYSSENRCLHGFAANAATDSKGRLVMIWGCLLPKLSPSHWVWKSLKKVSSATFLSTVCPNKFWISNLRENRILKFLSKKSVKLKGDLHCLGKV